MVYKLNIDNWYLDIDFNLEVCVIVFLQASTRVGFFKAVPSKYYPGYQRFFSRAAGIFGIKT